MYFGKCVHEYFVFSVRTELKDSAARSWLVIGRARIEDSGEYFCNASDIATFKVNIHVLSGINIIFFSIVQFI